MSSQALGVNPGHWYDEPQFKPGTEGSTGDADWVFTQSVAGCVFGDVLVLDPRNRALRLTAASARAEGSVGICQTDTAVPAGKWFWAMRRGFPRFRAAADCMPSATLYPTAVPGVVDDEPGTYALEGLVAGEAAGAGGIVSGRMAWAALREGRGGGGGPATFDAEDILDEFKDPRTNDDRGGFLRVSSTDRNAGQISGLPDATTTVKGVVRLADAGEADAGTALEVMDAAQTKRVLEERTPAATESRMGLVEFADTAEADAGVQWRGMDAAQTKRRIEAAIAAIPPSSGGGPSGTPPAGVLAKSNPAADVVTPGAAAINNWGAWTDIVSTPAVTAEQAGLLEVFTTGHGVVSAYPGAPALAGGGDRVQTHLRIRRTRGADTTTILDQDIYGPRNLTLAGNAMYSAATRVQDFDFAIPENAQVGDVYTLQIRIITQTANRRQVSWGKDETCLILFRPAAAEPLATTSFYNRVNSARQYSIDSGTNAGDWGTFVNTIESMEATAETAGRAQVYLQVKLDASYLSGAALGGDDDAIITHLACSIQGPAPASTYIRASLDQELYGPRNNQGASSTGFRDASDRLALAYTIPVDLEVGQKFRIAFRCMAQKGRRRLITDQSQTWLVHYRIGGGGGGSGGGGTGGLDKEAVEDAAAGLLTKGDDAAATDIAAAYDDSDASVGLTVKADAVTPAKAKFKTGRAADKWVKLSSDGMEFEGADAPSGGGSPPAAASETVAGIVELADNAEVDAGTDDKRAVTPAGLRRSVGAEVTSAEIAAGTETGVRRWSPEDIKSFVDEHAAASGGDETDAVEYVHLATSPVLLRTSAVRPINRTPVASAWTNAADVPADLTPTHFVDGITYPFQLPRSPPAGVIGLAFAVEVGGVEYARSLTGWGIDDDTREAVPETNLYIPASSITGVFMQKKTRVGDKSNVAYTVYSAGDTFGVDTNTRIKAYAVKINAPGGSTSGGGINTEAAQDAAAGLLTKGDDAAAADIAAAYDDPDASVALTVKPDRVTPAKAKFKTGTRAADKWVKISDDGTEFEGADAPSGGSGGPELVLLWKTLLPTSSGAKGTAVTTAPTIEARSAREGFEVYTRTNGRVAVDRLPPSGAIGLMAVVASYDTMGERGSELARAFFPYPYAPVGGDVVNTIPIGRNQSIQIYWQGQESLRAAGTTTDQTAGWWQARSAGSGILPARTYIEMYGVLGGGGGGGDDGGSPTSPSVPTAMSANALLSAALPNALAQSAGEIRNLDGVLYERVLSSEDPHVVSGVAAAQTSPYVGGPIIEWDPTGVSTDIIRAHFSATAPGFTPTPPTRVWLSFGDERHFHADAVLERDNALDAAGTLGYSEVGSVAVDTPLGTKYRAEFYTVAGGPSQGTALAVHAAATARWELQDRDLEARIQESVPPPPTAADYGKVAQATAAGPVWAESTLDAANIRIDASNLNVPTAEDKRNFRNAIGAPGGSGLLRWWTRSAAGGLSNAHMTAPSATVNPTKIAVDGEFFYVYDSQSAVVRCYNRATGAAVPVKNLTANALSTAFTAGYDVGGMTVHGGLLYVVDKTSDRVAVWTVGAANAALVYNAAQSVSETVLRGLSASLEAVGIATDGDTLWIADASDHVYAVDISMSPPVRAASEELTAVQVRTLNAGIEIRGLAYADGGLWILDRTGRKLSYISPGTATRDEARDISTDEFEFGVEGTPNVYGCAYDPSGARMFLSYFEQKIIRAWDHGTSAVTDSFPGVNALPVNPDIGQGFTALGAIRVPGRGILNPGTESGVRGYFNERTVGSLEGAPQNGVLGLYYATLGPDMGKVLFLRDGTHYNKTAHTLDVLPRGAAGFTRYTFGAGTTPNSRAVTGAPADIFSVPSAVQITATDGTIIYADTSLISGRRYEWDGLDFDLLSLGTENIEGLVRRIINEQIGGIIQTVEDRWFNLTINSSLLNTQQPLSLFQTPTVIGPADRGVILTVVQFRVSAGSTSQYSLGEQSVQQSDTVLLQPLRSTPAYLAGFSTLYGEIVAGVDIFPISGGVVGSNRIGRVDIRAAHDADDTTGQYGTFTREESTGTSLPGVIQYHFRSVILRTG